MGLATIDPRSQKEHTEIHKIPKSGVNRASFDWDTGKKFTKIYVWKCGQIRTNVCICPHFRVYLGVRTCGLFLCFVAIVRVRVYYVEFFVFFVLRLD